MNAKFLDDFELSRSEFPQNVQFEESKDSSKVPINSRSLVIIQENLHDNVEEQQIKDQVHNVVQANMKHMVLEPYNENP